MTIISNTKTTTTIAGIMTTKMMAMVGDTNSSLFLIL
jgi:hypothetical protein